MHLLQSKMSVDKFWRFDPADRRQERDVDKDRGYALTSNWLIFLSAGGSNSLVADKVTPPR